MMDMSHYGVCLYIRQLRKEKRLQRREDMVKSKNVDTVRDARRQIEQGTKALAEMADTKALSRANVAIDRQNCEIARQTCKIARLELDNVGLAEDVRANAKQRDALREDLKTAEQRNRDLINDPALSHRLSNEVRTLKQEIARLGRRNADLTASKVFVSPDLHNFEYSGSFTISDKYIQERIDAAGVAWKEEARQANARADAAERRLVDDHDCAVSAHQTIRYWKDRAKAAEENFRTEHNAFLRIVEALRKELEDAE
jgi:hypothetical protein